MFTARERRTCSYVIRIEAVALRQKSVSLRENVNSKEVQNYVRTA
jgi:hypothetical protein